LYNNQFNQVENKKPCSKEGRSLEISAAPKEASEKTHTAIKKFKKIVEILRFHRQVYPGKVSLVLTATNDGLEKSV
jgi:hypothetical protein